MAFEQPRLGYHLQCLEDGVDNPTFSEHVVGLEDGVVGREECLTALRIRQKAVRSREKVLCHDIGCKTARKKRDAEWLAGALCLVEMSRELFSVWTRRRFPG